MNGDDIDDVLISAYGANNKVGQTYVVFGSKEKWPVIINLADLNGTNGFAINGINSGNLYAISVNGDGVADILIGTGDNNNNVGQSYVVFGCCGKAPSANTVFILELALGIGGGILT